jgi:hypothetical protein
MQWSGLRWSAGCFRHARTLTHKMAHARTGVPLRSLPCLFASQQFSFPVLKTYARTHALAHLSERCWVGINDRAKDGAYEWTDGVKLGVVDPVTGILENFKNWAPGSRSRSQSVSQSLTFFQQCVMQNCGIRFPVKTRDRVTDSTFIFQASRTTLAGMRSAGTCTDPCMLTRPSMASGVTIR